MSPAAIEKERNEELDQMLHRLNRDYRIGVETHCAAHDWVQMTRAEVSREKKNALRPGRASSLRSRLKNLVVLIVTHAGTTLKG